jgi:hypothetical protein
MISREFITKLSSNKPLPLARGKVFNSKSHYIVLDASSGQLLRDEERGADFSRNTEGGHLRNQIQEQKNKCSPSLTKRFQERKLRRLANISAKLFNELNCEKRQQF